MIEYKKRRGRFWKLEKGVRTSISAEEYEAAMSIQTEVAEVSPISVEELEEPLDIVVKKEKLEELANSLKSIKDDADSES